MNKGNKAYKYIEPRARGRVSLIKFNRDSKLNALNKELIDELEHQLRILDSNDMTSVVVLYGSDKAFAAGADVSEMNEKNFADCYNSNFLKNWDYIAKFSKPLIAAASGFVLGGGLELAMSCDIIYASNTAQFGQPEVRLGLLPGCGGTQRLIRAVGKSKAMEMCLGAVPISAKEALEYNLISKIFPSSDLLGETIKLADKISRFSLPVLRMLKQCLNNSYEMNLQSGIIFEKNMFYSAFALHDSYEGINAFLERRNPSFNHK